MKKILIVTPRAPFQGRGADEQDRLEGIKWFIKKGFETRVITMALPGDIQFVDEAKRSLGIEITPVLYKFKGRKDWLKRLFNPRFWDGAAYEYFDKEIQDTLRKALKDFNPDFVWFDYTYLWPLYHLVGEAKIITRSINFEPTHFLDEDGFNPINFIRVLPKLYSEWRAFNGSDHFFSITPKEEKIYKRFGKTPTSTLPLRALPSRIGFKRKENGDGDKIRIGFTASNYNVSHNLEALKFILDKILPKLSSNILDKIELHFTGSKLPKSVSDNLPNNVFYRGFVPNSLEFWSEMDIALAPSVFGSGMQQKIFEPLTLGVPTITSSRGLAGYMFIDGESVVCAGNIKEFAKAIEELVTNSNMRRSLGKGAREVSLSLFNQNLLDKNVESILL